MAGSQGLLKGMQGKHGRTQRFKEGVSIAVDTALPACVLVLYYIDKTNANTVQIIILVSFVVAVR